MWFSLLRIYRSWPTNDVISHRDYMKLYKNVSNQHRLILKIAQYDSESVVLSPSSGDLVSVVFINWFIIIISSISWSYIMKCFWEKKIIWCIIYIKIGSQCLFNKRLSWFHMPRWNNKGKDFAHPEILWCHLQQLFPPNISVLYQKEKKRKTCAIQIFVS